MKQAERPGVLRKIYRWKSRFFKMVERCTFLLRVGTGGFSFAPMILYRMNVAALLENSSGKIFIGERKDTAGAWQFPQGGVDTGEKLKAALRREMKEEIGVKRRHVEILESKGGYRYKFPNGRVRWGKYRGQKQRYFRCLFLGKDKHIDLETDHPEFSDWRWIQPDAFRLGWLPEFKWEVYAAVLRDFYGVEAKV